MTNVFLRNIAIANVQDNPILYRLAFFYHCYFTPALVPPKLFNFVGYDQFVKIGKAYLGYIKDFACLEPGHSVLDIGCGIGRVALPFSEYLSTDGSYEGFDIVDLGIRWCRHKITRRFPNFRFQKVDLHNKEYNPKGTLNASNFNFPYADNSFDVAFATSVFTHMFPEAIENYTKELSRVLKPGGRAVCTFFVLDDESKRLMATSNFPFKKVEGEPYSVMVDFNPENAIAYEIEDVKKFFTDQGLTIDEPIRFGTWSGREGTVGGQDMVVVEKC